MTERKRAKKTNPPRPESILTPEKIAEVKNRIIQRSRQRMHEPSADRGRIRSETLGQLYALTRDEAQRRQFRRDIQEL